MRPGANSTIFRFGLEDFTPPDISSQKKNVDEKQRKPLVVVPVVGIVPVANATTNTRLPRPIGGRGLVLSLPLILIISQYL